METREGYIFQLGCVGKGGTDTSRWLKGPRERCCNCKCPSEKTRELIIVYDIFWFFSTVLKKMLHFPTWKILTTVKRVIPFSTCRFQCYLLFFLLRKIIWLVSFASVNILLSFCIYFFQQEVKSVLGLREMEVEQVGKLRWRVKMDTNY